MRPRKVWCRVDQARNFLARENLRQAFWDFGHGDVEAHLGLAQHGAEQKAERAGSLIDAGVGELALGDQMQQVGLDPRPIDDIRGLPVVLCQGAYAGQVRLTRARGKPSQHHRLIHPIAQFGHLALLT